MEIHNVDQGTDEWFALRAGRPTATGMKNLFTSSFALPKGITQGMLTYAAELAADVVAGYPLSHEESFGGTWAMERGKELESIARDEYAFIANNEVTQVGFVTNHGAGCSPDSFVGDQGLLEIKCLLAKAHTLALAEIRQRQVPKDYYIQCQAQMWICERRWCDLYFYHPVLKSAVIRVDADKDFHDLMDKQVQVILAERDKLIEALREE